jgi:hypothetical protein
MFDRFSFNELPISATMEDMDGLNNPWDRKFITPPQAKDLEEGMCPFQIGDYVKIWYPGHEWHQTVAEVRDLHLAGKKWVCELRSGREKRFFDAADLIPQKSQ